MHHFDIVSVGGGTGLFTTLRSLRKLQETGEPCLLGLDLRLSAIVSVADDGGSTGRLRDEFGYLPPGDLRRALVALSHDTGSLRQLFNYRFQKGAGLAGHNVGNLLLTALTDIYGGEYEAIKHAGRILRVKGRVIPVTTDNARLVARLEDGKIIRGETNIDIPKHDGKLKIIEEWLDPKPKLFASAREALLAADMITIGPGDLYTSLLPNLLVEGFVETVIEARRRGAAVVLITNTMTKFGETNGYTARDFVDVIEAHVGKGILTHLICNTTRPTEEAMRGYRDEHAEFVEPDVNDDDKIVIERALLSGGELARHDTTLLAGAYSEVISSRLRAIILDLDDTLIQTSRFGVPDAEMRTRKRILELGYDEKFADRLFENRKSMGMMMALKAEKLPQNIIDDLFNAYSESPLGAPFPEEDIGAIDDLRRVARLFLLTKGNVERQKAKIELHDLEKYFERMVICDVRKDESKEEALRMLLRERRLDPQHTFVVGDNLHDEIAAADAIKANAILLDRDDEHPEIDARMTSSPSLRTGHLWGRRSSSNADTLRPQGRSMALLRIRTLHELLTIVKGR